MQVVRNPRVNPMAQTMRLPASVARAAAAGGRKGDLSRPQLKEGGGAPQHLGRLRLKQKARAFYV